MTHVASALLESLYASLIGDLHWSFEQIANATDRQIFDIALHKRDEHGRLEERVEVEEDALAHLTPRERDRVTLYSTGAAMGIKRDVLDLAWRKKYPDDDPSPP